MIGAPVKPPYLRTRTRGGVVSYQWSIPKDIAPEFRPRAVACGRDLAAAVAIATRMNERAGVGKGRHSNARTGWAKDFARLDRISRERSLTDIEMRAMQRLMGKLGMVELWKQAEPGKVKAA